MTRHRPALLRYALQLTKGRYEFAEDLVQTTYLKAHVAIQRGRYDGRNDLAWLARILFYTFVTEYHYQRRHFVEQLDFDVHPEPYVEPIEPTDQLDPAMQRALQGLPPHYLVPVLLVDLHDLTYEEAAQAMQCPTPTLGTRLHRARKQLKEVLCATTDSKTPNRCPERPAASTRSAGRRRARRATSLPQVVPTTVR